MKKLFKLLLVSLALVLAISVLSACDNEPAEYTVTFVYPDGEVISTQTVQEGYAATAPKVESTIGGVPFLEWDKDFSKVTEDITITAIYDFPTYTVSFDTKGGSTIEDQKVRYGKVPTRPDDPEKAGFTFSKWYEDPDFTIECKFDKIYDANVTIYAHFINDYISITNADELKAIKDNPSAKYILTNDINLAVTTWIPIDNFTGVIDGNGYKIHNFIISGTDQLVGFIRTNNGIIKNISFDEITFNYSHDCTLNGNAQCGVVAAINNGLIENCKLLSTSNSDITIYSDAVNRIYDRRYAYFGGFVGTNNGTITECENNIDIKCDTYCSNNNKYGWVGFNTYLAGISGYNTGTISKTKTTGKIIYATKVFNNGGNTDSLSFIAGITGSNSGTNANIFECTVLGDVIMTHSGIGLYKGAWVGLLVGSNGSGNVFNCSTKGVLNVSNEDMALIGSIGGGVGHNQGTVSNLCVDANIAISDSITLSIGGIVGNSETNAVSNKSIFVGDMAVGKDVASVGFAFGTQNGTELLCHYSNACTLTKSDTEIDPTNTLGTSIANSEITSESFIFDTLGWDKTIWKTGNGKNPTLLCFEK